MQLHAGWGAKIYGGYIDPNSSSFPTASTIQERLEIKHEADQKVDEMKEKLKGFIGRITPW